jgi:hypothetical protein
MRERGRHGEHRQEGSKERKDETSNGKKSTSQRRQKARRCRGKEGEEDKRIEYMTRRINRIKGRGSVTLHQGRICIR